VSGEGYFGVKIGESSSHKLGTQIQLEFKISQHSRDELLLKSFNEYLGCGKVYKQSKDAVEFRVTKLSDIIDKIIPFFDKYPVVGVKGLDYADFCKVAILMKDNSHLTPLGLLAIPPATHGKRV